MIGSASPAPFPNASATQKGVVTTLAQTFAGLKTFQDGIIAASLLGAGAGDVCNKIGTSVADGSVDFRAKLLSIRTGLGGTEVEYARFMKPTTSAFNGLLELDAKSVTNFGALNILNGGTGDNGIFFQGGNSSGGAQICVGQGMFDFFAVNRLFRFNVNSDVFSSPKNSSFDFNRADATAYPIMRLVANASQTGKFLSLVLGATEKFFVDKDGGLQLGLAGRGIRYDAGGDRIQIAGGVNGVQILNATYAAFAALECGGLIANGLARLGAGISAGNLGGQVPSGVHFGLNGNTDTTFIASDATGAASIIAAVGNVTSMTLSPTQLLTPGDFETNVIGKGFVLKSPDGTRYRIKVANGGALSTEAA